MNLKNVFRWLVPILLILAVGALVAQGCGTGEETTTQTAKTRPDDATATSKTAPSSSTSSTLAATSAPTTAPTTQTTAPTTTQTTMPTTTEFTCAGLCAKITNLIEDNGELIVQWETFNYEPSTSNFHAHFFFDIYDPKSVGTNFAENGAASRGSWQLTDDQPFFTKSSSVALANAPADATKLCVVAADSGHGVVNPENFECVDLPGMMEDEGDAMEDESEDS